MVLQDVAAILLRVTKEVLSGYARMVTLSFYVFYTQFIHMYVHRLINFNQCVYLEVELTLSVILDDYLKKAWVFVVEPP